MTQKTAGKYLPLIQAWSEGKTIQVTSGPSADWWDATVLDFNCAPECYRIKPEPKLRVCDIAGRRCEFNSDGTVKLSCGTVISNEEIEAFLKNRQEAKESEWPKYFTRRLRNFGVEVVRSWGPQDDGERFECGWNKFMDGVPVLNCAENTPHIYKPISRAQAAAMIGEENLSK